MEKLNRRNHHRPALLSMNLIIMYFLRDTLILWSSSTFIIICNVKTPFDGLNTTIRE